MVKKLLMTAVAAAGMTTSAHAVTVVSFAQGSAASYALPVVPNSVGIDFESGGVPAGFTLTGGQILSGDSNLGAEPAFATPTPTKYLSSIFNPVGFNNATVLSTGAGYDAVSIYFGSLDAYNTLQILAVGGAVLKSYTGSELAALLSGPADGNQDLGNRNGRITFGRQAADAAIGGFKLITTDNSFEVDNVLFAVPEPSTWMMMLGGFALVGGAMRSRRRKTLNTVFA